MSRPWQTLSIHLLPLRPTETTHLTQEKSPFAVRTTKPSSVRESPSTAVLK